MPRCAWTRAWDVERIRFSAALGQSSTYQSELPSRVDAEFDAFPAAALANVEGAMLSDERQE